MEEHLYGNDNMLGAKTLDAIQAYFSNDIKMLPDYDIVLAMTRQVSYNFRKIKNQTLKVFLWTLSSTTQ